MRKFVLVLSVNVLGAFVAIAVTSHAFSSVNAQNGFKAHSLLAASVADVQKAALDFTYSNYRVLSAPKILLTRSITRQEIPKLGLSEFGIGGKEPPLALVALEGKFEVQPRGLTTAGPEQVKYIFYVLDLNAGVPTYIEFSREGKGYAKFFAYAKTFTPLAGDQPIDPNAKNFEPEPIQTEVPAVPTPGPSAPEKP